jgi:hypothetical protein
MQRRRLRAGVTVVQWVIIAALLVMGAVGGAALIGTGTNNKLNQTATDVGNPQNLTTRFGS